MRKITLIIVHCSAVRPGQTSSAAQIDRWHRQRGFKNGIGYHYVVRRDGTIEGGRPEDMVGAHCKGHNAHSIGVCYEGGLDANGKAADTRTPQQKAALSALIRSLRQSYPGSIVVGHRDLSPDRNHDGRVTPNEWTKSCPCFDAAKEYRDL